MSALRLHAFRALGPGPTRREIALVATALRDSGDEDVGPLLDYTSNPAGWDRCVAMSDEAGAYGFVALDLALAFHNPAHFATLIPEGAEDACGATATTRPRDVRFGTGRTSRFARPRSASFCGIGGDREHARGSNGA